MTDLDNAVIHHRGCLYRLVGETSSVMLIFTASLFCYPLLLLFSPPPLLLSITACAIAVAAAIASISIVPLFNATHACGKSRQLIWTSFAVLTSLLCLHCVVSFLTVAANSPQRHVLEKLSTGFANFCEFTPPGFVNSLHGVMLPALSAFCLCVILLHPRKLLEIAREGKLLSFSCLVFLAVCLFHILIIPKYKPDDFFFSLLWITFPLFALICGGCCRSLLPYYMLTLWSMNMSYSILQITRGSEVVGLAGNRNWNALLTIVTTVFACHALNQIVNAISGRLARTGRLTPEMRDLPTLVPYIAAMIIACPSAYVVYKCDSRGAVLGLLVSVFVFVFLFILDRRFKAKLRLLLYTGLALVGTLALGRNSIPDLIDADVRIPMWEGCLALVVEHPFSGVGTGCFVNEFAMHRPVEYFKRNVAAVYSNHPHNSPLYILASFGGIGLAAWLIVWVLPLLWFPFIYGRVDGVSRLMYQCYIIIFTHSLFDLALFEWPNLVIGGILLGLLWRELSPSTDEDGACRPLQRAPKPPLWISLPMRLGACAAMLLGMSMIRADLLSSYYHRTGEFWETRGRSELALHYFDKALGYKMDTKYIYKAGICALVRQQNPELALKYFNMLEETTCGNFAHSHGFAALCLRRLRRTKEALPHLVQEVRAYPFLAASWFNLAQAQKELKLPEARYSMEVLGNVLAEKGFSFDMLPYLLANPEWDMHPAQIPVDLRERFKLRIRDSGRVK